MSDAATRIEWGHDGESRVWAAYDLGGWIVRIASEVNAPFDGPSEVQIFLDTSDEGLGDAVELAEASGGVTAGVLRSVPLADARKLLRRLRSDLLVARDEGAYDLPDRMVTLADWVTFARAYARSATRNVHQPLSHLAKATGLSINTINARIRRAQELDLLEDSGGGWLILTEKAKTFAEGSDG